MNVLDQARLAVAERVIAAQRREMLGLEIQNEIAQRRANVATLLHSPYAPIGIMALIYAAYCAVDLYLTNRRKGKSSEPRA